MNLEFITVLVFTAIGAGFVFASLVAGYFLRPRIPNPEKDTTYECGERPYSQAWFNFNPRFYILALIFLVFDVAIALLFPPLSVLGEQIRQGGAGVMVGIVFFFMGILALALAYVWGKGDLEWIKK